MLVTTLRRTLDQADAYFRAGRVPVARRAYEELLERAQERTDRAMEVVARAMLARCQLKARDLDGAREQLMLAERFVHPRPLAPIRSSEPVGSSEPIRPGEPGGSSESVGRFLAARARLAVEDGPAELARRELLAYVAWAEREEARREVLDACLLIAAGCELAERVDWLERGIEHARHVGGDPELGRAWTELGAALDQLGRPEEALGAYEAAYAWTAREREAGRARGRQVVGAAWAVGSVACRVEDWPLARARLEEALEIARRAEDAVDLLGLVCSELALVYEAAGDVVEARRLVIEALASARQQDLATAWPGRWRALVAQARRLELEP